MLLQLSHSFYYFFYNFYYNFQYYSQHNLRHPFKIKLLLPIIVLQVLCSTGYFKWEAALFLRPFFISFVKWHTESAFAPPSNISGDMHAPHAPQSRLHTHAVQTDTHSHTHIQAHVSTCVMCVCLATVFDCAACLPPGNKLNDLLNDVHFMQLDRARVISSENERGERDTLSRSRHYVPIVFYCRVSQAKPVDGTSSISAASREWSQNQTQNSTRLKPP